MHFTISQKKHFITYGVGQYNGVQPCQRKTFLQSVLKMNTYIARPLGSPSGSRRAVPLCGAHFPF